MAIFDAMFEFMDNQEITGSGTTLFKPVTGKELNWGNNELEMGAGEPVYINFKVGLTAFTGGTSVDFKLFADAASEGHDSDSDVVLASGPRLVADLTAGAWILRNILPVDVDIEQYLLPGATFVGNVNAGTLDVWLDHGSQSSYDTQVSDSNI